MMARNSASNLVAGAASKYTARRGWINIGAGLRMFGSRSVPASCKLLALLLGGTLTGLIIALEVSPEMVLALAFNIPGAIVDLVADGLECVILPVVFGAAILPHLLPAQEIDRANLQEIDAVR